MTYTSWYLPNGKDCALERLYERKTMTPLRETPNRYNVLIGNIMNVGRKNSDRFEGNDHMVRRSPAHGS